MIVIVSLEEPHPDAVIVQTNVLAPTLRPVTPDVGLPGVVTDALPAMTVQAPVPTVGVFPARVAVVAQTDWSGPAFDIDGGVHKLTVGWPEVGTGYEAPVQLVFATALPDHVKGEPVAEAGEVALIEKTMVSFVLSRSGLELAVNPMVLPVRVIDQLCPEAETIDWLPSPVNTEGTVSVIHPMTPVPVFVAVMV